MCVGTAASSKSKKAKWRKWADQKLERKKAAVSTADVSATAAEPDPSQLPIAEITQPQPSSGSTDAATLESARKVETTGIEVAPAGPSDDVLQNSTVHDPTQLSTSICHVYLPTYSQTSISGMASGA